MRLGVQTASKTESSAFELLSNFEIPSRLLFITAGIPKFLPVFSIELVQHKVAVDQRLPFFHLAIMICFSLVFYELFIFLSNGSGT